MKDLVRVFREVFRLSLPYFRSEDRRAGLILLGAVIGIELSIVAVNVLINQWNARFFNALQERNWDQFVRELSIFCVLAGIFIVLAVYQLYLNQWLQIRWRTWMTRVYLDRWLNSSTHYRMQLFGDAADNPDQRIADDINQFIEKSLTIVVRLLGAIVTLLSFFAILWGLSESAPLTLFGSPIAIPGYLVWIALVYSVIGTLLAHWIGWPLAAINFRQQRFEADFRFNLIRVRENAEQIALMRGEEAEKSRLGDRFSKVIRNFMDLMSRQKKVIFVQQGHAQVAIILPYVVVSPAYFSGAVPLGTLTQTASAFNSVQESLSFFVTFYRSIAEWAAVVDRLSGFNRSLDQAEAMAATSSIAVSSDPGARSVRIENLSVHRPDNKPLLTPTAREFHPREHVLVSGPSGAGKSTLFRAIAGLWPFGSGRVVIPDGARIMVLPQRPYFPETTLANALSYPASDAFDDAALTEVLRAVGLPALSMRLHEEAHWNRTLSLGEQQRLGVARALLQAPDYLFLDEATASLDEPSEAKLYGLLQERLKGTTIVSIGHRSTLTGLHDRHVAFEPDGDSGHKLAEKKPAAAAE
ncbi:ABC transporter ATP-binding protein/permease [Pseudorhodoplanes sp.]|uniref:ABC transporter ATP-binding protein/permease n=1 Tax=Pseudorhodoplanes sp. TaxID=1934341 RepID=UPI002CE34A15|nr:ABC transporter ATP-binding protein/permease [Pseudorhodoplanes sp.]HWV54914.1 ABC transporter ATP-binding protein/permease [Pseudorhodoplanes sp.]